MGDNYINNGTNSGHIGPVNNFGPKPFIMTQARLALYLRDIREVLKEGQSVRIIRLGGSAQTISDADKLRNFFRANGVNVIDGPNIQVIGPPVVAPVTFRVMEGPISGPSLLIDSEKVDPRER